MGLVALSGVTYHSGDPRAAVLLAEDAIGLLQNDADRLRDLYLEALSRRCHAMVELDGPGEELRRATDVFLAEVNRLGGLDYVRACALFGVGWLQMHSGEMDAAGKTFAETKRLSRQCGWISGEAHSDMLLACGILRRCPRQPRDSEEALHRLGSAVQTFERQRNVSDTLAALFAGTLALAEIGAYEAAGRLRNALWWHADRVGANPCRFSAAGADAELQQTLAEHDYLDDSTAVLDWPQMIELFTAEVNRLAGAQSH